LHLGGAEALTYKLQPLVVLSILDHFKRRDEGVDAVVGTLLGQRRGSIVHVSDCFPVPFHVENQANALFDKDYHDNMLALHLKTNPKKAVVGWYTTGDKITFISALMHQHYHTECKNPVLLTVDVGLTNSRMAVRAYTGVTITRDDPRHYQTSTGLEEASSSNEVIARFTSAPVEYSCSEAEKVGVDAMINSTPEGQEFDAPASFVGGLESLENALVKLKDSIDSIQLYVQKVQDGEIKGDPVVGRQIANALAQVPYFNPEAFNNNVQDLLMIVYLANITRTQLGLSSKIHSLS
jgi:translation initiation factor 3 subunit F